MQLTLSTTERRPSPSLRRTGRHENASARLWIWPPTQRRKGKSLETHSSKWVRRFEITPFLKGAKNKLLICSLSSFISLWSASTAALYSCLIWILHRWQMKWLGRWIWSQRRSSWPRVPYGLISLRVPLISPAARRTSSKRTTTTPSSSANSEMR